MLMDSTFFLTTTIVAATIGFFTLLKNSRFHEDNKVVDSSSSSSSPPSSSLSCNWTHDVFPSFRGEDVRAGFLSHIRKEFKRKGITLFIDNKIKKGESIGPELVKAISRSKIAVVLISSHYASSKWCLDELVEIMKCKKELGQTVFVVFYKVDPSHVKMLTGEFGDVFRKTCVGKTKEDIKRWRQAFKEVSTVAGYDSRNWNNEATMIEEIVAEIWKILIASTPPRYLKGLVGMEAHMEKIKPLLCLGLDKARLIGIWGPPGIGKTTIARAILQQYSCFFQLSAFIEIKPSYERPTCSDDYNAKLQLEQQLISQLINQKDIKVPHLGAAQSLLMDKKTLIVLDGVNQLVQLLTIPKAQCLGSGTRIIITTQDQKLLNAFDVKHVYNVGFPPANEALQIFCINAFGMTSPKNGFEDLAKEVTKRVGSLPLGLRIMGSHFRGTSKNEWERELPRLRVHLDGEIGSILKFSYDALNPEDKDLFLYIACFFVEERIDEIIEDVLGHKFSNVRQGLTVLSQKSLIFNHPFLRIHSLLVELGREIVRNQSISEPGKRQFLIDAKEISEVLTYNTGSKSVIGINFDTSMIDDDLEISEAAFEEMSSLEFLRVHGGDYYRDHKRLLLKQGLKYLPPKLRILRWDRFPSTCLTSNFNTKFLVKLQMERSNLEKLWDGIQPLKNLKFMSLNHSYNLKELPDLSTATNLQDLHLVHCNRLVEINTVGNATNLRILNLQECSSLVELPSSIGNACKFLRNLNLSSCSSLVELPSSIGNACKFLRNLYLGSCSNLVELPSSIGNAVNLKELNLNGCSSLVELPSSIGNLVHLERLELHDCYSLVKLPSSIGNVTSLQTLSLSGCLRLVELPSSIGNLTNLESFWLADLESLVDIPASIGSIIDLQELNVSGCRNLVEIPSSIGSIINLKRLKLARCSSLLDLPSSIGNAISLQELDLSGCSSLVEIPSFVWILTNLEVLDLSGCLSLVEIPSSIGNLRMLRKLSLLGCSNLEVFPININLESLEEIDVTGCSRLVCFPEISTNVQRLMLCGTSIKEFPLSIKSWSRLQELGIPYLKNLEEFPQALDIITELELNDTEMQQIPPLVNGISDLRRLVLNNCTKLESLPQLPGSLDSLHAENCVSLEKVDCSFPSSLYSLTFINCWKLNEKARDIIIQARTYGFVILPGKEVHGFFTNRVTNGGSLTVKLNNERCFPTSLRFKVCIMLVNKSGNGVHDEEPMSLFSTIMDKQSGLDIVPRYLRNHYRLWPLLTEHLYIYEVEVRDVKSSELLFEFKAVSDEWEIAEYGVRELSQMESC